MEECPFHAKAESLLAVRGLLSPWSDKARSRAYLTRGWGVSYTSAAASLCPYLMTAPALSTSSLTFLLPFQDMSPLLNVVLGKEPGTKVWTASASSRCYKDDGSEFQRQQSIWPSSLGSSDGSLTPLLGNIWPVAAPLWASLPNSGRETVIIGFTEHSCPDKDRAQPGLSMFALSPAASRGALVECQA